MDTALKVLELLTKNFPTKAGHQLRICPLGRLTLRLFLGEDSLVQDIHFEPEDLVKDAEIIAAEITTLILVAS